MIISTYTEYDENGKIKSQTTTQYEDDIDMDECPDEECQCCCGACDEDAPEDISLTWEDLYAIAMRSVGLTESIHDPRVGQFVEAVEDLLNILAEGDDE